MNEGVLAHRRIAAQARAELILAVRRGESLLLIVVIPTVMLVYFGFQASGAVDPAGMLDTLVPGVLGLAIMSTAMVNLGVATAFERHYHVLKRLGGSPLSRLELLAAKGVTVLVVEVAQTVLLLGIARFAFGWVPHGDPALALSAFLLGTVAFAGLGFVIAGAVRAEASIALANGLYLAFLLLSGTFGSLPSALGSIAPALPATALAEVFRAALAEESSVPWASLLVLIGWAVAMPLAAARTFRWE